MNVFQDDVAAADEADVAARQTRIDAPHQQPRASQANDDAGGTELAAPFDLQAAGTALLEVEEPTAEMVAAVAGENLEIRREQLQLQVAQLAAHLRQRLREVDRREAAVNARLAQLECD